MNRTHLSPDQLIDAMYGTVPEDAHLDACPECRARLQSMQDRRALSVDGPRASDVFFHQQRRRIMDRLAEPQRPAFAPVRSVWVPAAVAALMVVGIVISRPGDTPAVGDATELQEIALDASDAGWFEDTFSELQASEPRALNPMRNLFSEGALQ
jgi:anti-sigma factor RsiW